MNQVKKKSTIEKKNQVSHQIWQERKKLRNQAQYQLRREFFNFIKTESGDYDYLVKCDFCLKNKVKANRNFYIHNRYKVVFWTQNHPNSKLICSDCLFDWKEIEIEEIRRNIFRVYKMRYFSEKN